MSVRKGLSGWMVAMVAVAALTALLAWQGRRADVGDPVPLPRDSMHRPAFTVPGRAPGGQHVAAGAVATVLAMADSKEAALRQLIAQAESGSVEHLLAVHALVAACRGGREKLAADMAELAPPSAQRELEWQRQVRRELDYCGEPGDLDRRGEKTLKNLHDRMEMLAANGDQFAALYLISTNPQGGRMTGAQAAFIKEALPDFRRTTLASRAAYFYLRSPNEEVEEIDRRMAVRKLSPEGSTKVKQAAATLYQCHWGGDFCGPGSRLVGAQCLAYGHCDPGLSLSAYYRQYRLSSDEALAMDLYLQLLLAGG